MIVFACIYFLKKGAAQPSHAQESAALRAEPVPEGALS